MIEKNGSVLGDSLCFVQNPPAGSFLDPILRYAVDLGQPIQDDVWGGPHNYP